MISRLTKRILAASPTGLALLAALGIIVGSIGFPMPPLAMGGAFPCQGHGCGCGSAEACWLGCCCLTPAQRLAWAKENGVTPPPEFLASLTMEDRAEEAETRPKASTAVASCCGGEKSSCCEVKISSCCEAEAKSCCKKGHVHAANNADSIANADESENKQPRVRAGCCHGLGHWWIAGGQPLALPMKAGAVPRSGWEIELTIFESRYEADRDSPPTRPG